MSTNLDLKPVVAAVIPRGRKVLLTERRFHTHGENWSWPSGKVEPGETPKEALVRELYEELLIENAQVARELGDIDLPTGYRMTHFLVTIPDGYEPVNNDPDHLAEIRWMTREDAAHAFRTLDPDIASGALRLIDLALVESAATRSRRPVVEHRSRDHDIAR